jgi:flagellar P-ring protein precursor FlgI
MAFLKGEIVKRYRKKWILKCLLASFMLCWLCPASLWAARLKDIATLKGLRQNQLIGYGLVVGLAGTGDGTKAEFTIQSLVNLLERLGIHTIPDNIKVENVAAVMLTADLPPFAQAGSTIDVLVSSIGDAESLLGGTLLLAPLKGVDGQVYALAQGPLVVGGFSSSAQPGVSVQKNIPTVGRIPGGGTIERELEYDIKDIQNLTIALHNPDFTTALRISDAINEKMEEPLADPRDAGTVKVRVTDSHRQNLVSLIASLEQIDVTPDMHAKVILNERTGTVIMGANVRISSVAIAHGNLSVEIQIEKRVSQPNAFSRRGNTVVVDDTDINVNEDENRLVLVPEGTNLGDVVKALNAIGVSPRDLITVLQSIRACGALQADLEVI